jgi:restriction endonuclease S subunit
MTNSNSSLSLSPSSLKKGWQIVKFGEIAKNISKRVNPSETDLEVYVGLEHLDPQSLRITRRGVPADVKGQKLRVRPGQIIFGKRRAYQKKVAVADFDGICSAHAMVLEAVPGKIIPELLPFFMQSGMFMDRAVAISEGSLSPTIKWKTLAIQKFSLPPLERQKEILEVLEKVEEISLKNEQLITHSETFFSVLLQELISGSKNNPKDEVVSIFEIALITNSPVDKKSKKGEPTVKLCNYVDVYNNREIKRGIDFMVATAGIKEIEKFSLNEGDVVITKDSETPDDIAVPAYIAETIPDLVCGYHLSILKPTERVKGKYLSYALSTKKAKHDFT